MTVHIKFRSCSGTVDMKLYFLHFQDGDIIRRPHYRIR